MSFSWEMCQIFLIKMQLVTAYNNQRLKNNRWGGGEEEKQKTSPNKFPAATVWIVRPELQI